MKNQNKNSFYLPGITIVATLGGLLFGYDTAVISGTVGSLRTFFVDPMGLPLDQANAFEGFIVSSALIGCVIGASVAGFISQRFGRKPSLMFAAVLFLLSAIGSAWPEIFVGKPGSGGHEFAYIFVMYRILGGIGVGIASMVSPMYIAEISPYKKRGALVSWNQFAIIFGMLVVYFVNYSIALKGDSEWLNSIGWRWMFASETIPAFLFLVLLILAILTVDKFGRKPLLIIGALVMAVSMAGLGTGFAGGWSGGIKLFFMLSYTAGFAMSWGPVCWVMLAEIFPNSVRSTVMSIAVPAQWVSNFLVSWTFPMMNKNEYLVNNFNQGFSYWVYGVMGILAAVFIWKMVPETKGKTFENMDKLWKKMDE